LKKIKYLGMKNYFKDVTTLIPPLYENTSPYTPHIFEIMKCHNEIENYFDNMVFLIKKTNFNKLV